MEKLGQAAAIVIVLLVIITGALRIGEEAQLRAGMDEESYEMYRGMMDTNGVWSTAFTILGLAAIAAFLLAFLAVTGVLGRK